MFCLNKFVFSPNRNLKWEGLRHAQLRNTCRMCVKAFVGSAVAGFFLFVCGVVLFCFFQEEGASLHCRVDGASVGILRPWHVI